MNVEPKTNVSGAQRLLPFCNNAKSAAIFKKRDEAKFSMSVTSRLSVRGGVEKSTRKEVAMTARVHQPRRAGLRPRDIYSQRIG